MPHGRLTRLDAMRIDVWSDVVCPFCWVGKKHLERALAEEGITDAQIVFHAFELNPAANASVPLVDHLAAKFGSEARVRQMWARLDAMAAPAGIRFAWDSAIGARTFDAHRLALHAQAQGLGAPMHERLMRAHFQDGLDVADPEILARLADELGVSGAREMLSSGARSDEVRADVAAARELGITGVPFFVLDGRLAVSGAQPVELFQDALRQARRP